MQWMVYYKKYVVLVAHHYRFHLPSGRVRSPWAAPQICSDGFTIFVHKALLKKTPENINGSGVDKEKINQ